jgi:hypothetical protein
MKSVPAPRCRWSQPDRLIELASSRAYVRIRSWKEYRPGWCSVSRAVLVSSAISRLALSGGTPSRLALVAAAILAVG